MKNKNYILFDLDGTLTDPGEGIINSLQYSLKHFNIKGKPETLRKFIGPPLIDSFMGFYGFDKETALKAIKYYRQYFHAEGVLQNYVYPGIDKLLKTLTARGKKLAVATTKPTVYALQVLEHFELLTYFPEDLVVGSFLDGRRTDKAELIQTALSLLDGDHDSTVMVGDRKFDILGAKAAKITPVGVTYGYGERAELEKAGAAVIVDSVRELSELLLGGSRQA
ncbi:MAG TPA: HAD hydrolase-like protein [Firmicutes bacterium]|nr:HAD hydrolase-like protein [Bacillota bacterium]